MMSVDIPLASVDRNRTRFYLPSENLAQPFNAFPPNRHEARIGEDLQRNGMPSRSKNAERKSTRQILPEDMNGKPKMSSISTPSSQQKAGSSDVRDIRCNVEQNEADYFGDPEGSGGRASPSNSSTFSDYADCYSEANSMSSSLEDEMGTEEGMRQLRALKDRTEPGSWTSKLVAEKEKRAEAEAAAAELQKQYAQLQLELQLLRQQEALCRKPLSDEVPSSDEEEARLIVGRLVAAIFARAVAADEVAQQWKGEVELLQRRVTRMGRMEQAIERQHESDRLARSTLQRKLLHGGLAVGCVAAGAFAAYLAVRWLQSTPRPASALQPTGAEVELQLEPSDVSAADGGEAAVVVAAGTLPHIGSTQLSTGQAVGDLISTAEVLKQAAIQQDVARGISLPAACDPAALVPESAAVSGGVAAGLAGMASGGVVVGAPASAWEWTFSVPAASRAMLSRLAAP